MCYRTINLVFWVVVSRYVCYSVCFSIFEKNSKVKFLIVVDRCGSLWVVVDRCGSLWVVPGFSNYDSPISCLNNALLHLSPSAKACQIQILKFTFTLTLYHVTIRDRSKGGAEGLIPIPLIFATKQRAMVQGSGTDNLVLARECPPPFTWN